MDDAPTVTHGEEGKTVSGPKRFECALVVPVVRDAREPLLVHDDLIGR